MDSIGKPTGTAAQASAFSPVHENPVDKKELPKELTAGQVSTPAQNNVSNQSDPMINPCSKGYLNSIKPMVFNLAEKMLPALITVFIYHLCFVRDSSSDYKLPLYLFAASALTSTLALGAGGLYLHLNAEANKLRKEKGIEGVLIEKAISPAAHLVVDNVIARKLFKSLLRWAQHEYNQKTPAQWGKVLHELAEKNDIPVIEVGKNLKNIKDGFAGRNISRQTTKDNPLGFAKSFKM